MHSNCYPADVGFGSSLLYMVVHIRHMFTSAAMDTFIQCGTDEVIIWRVDHGFRYEGWCERRYMDGRNMESGSAAERFEQASSGR